MLRAMASFPAAPRTRGHPMHTSVLTPSATGRWWHSPSTAPREPGSPQNFIFNFTDAQRAWISGTHRAFLCAPEGISGYGNAADADPMVSSLCLSLLAYQWGDASRQKLAYSDTAQLLGQNLFRCQSVLPFTMQPNGFQLAIMSHLITKALVIILH